MAEKIKKVEAPPQAPAQAAPDTKEVLPEVKAGPTGLDGFTADQLKEFYKKSPQMFEEAGVVQKKEEPKGETPAEKDEPAPPPGSAAPKYGEKEIKPPDDVPVGRGVVDAYIPVAKEKRLHTPPGQSQDD